MKKLFSLLKNELLTGLLLLVPVLGTAWIVWSVITAVDDVFPAKYRQAWGVPLPGLGLAAVLALALVIGLLAHNLVGRKLMSLFDAAVQRIPLFGTTYSLMKQVLEAMFANDGSSFSRAVLVQYPTKGAWAIAFVTQPAVTGRLADAVGTDVMSVYVPTTPNPTSGFYLLVEQSAVRDLDMPVEQAFKLVMTMGIADGEALATTARWTRPQFVAKG